VPREKQKRFLERIICGEECFHFSEVGSGKTKGKKNTYAVATLLPPRSSACP
jgi:hypothetical protein